MRYPIYLPNYMGCLIEWYESLTPFYTKMSFKILKFFTSTKGFLPSVQLYTSVNNYHIGPDLSSDRIN
jgi:hypothetical protein